MPKRFCMDCGRLYDRRSATGLRCPACQDKAEENTRARGRQYEATQRRPRGSSTARGYGSIYRKRAAELVARAKANGEACVLCGRPCQPGQAITAQHIDGDAATGNPATVRLGPAHSRCNSADGGRRRR